jgi:hypothetical protein
MENMLIFHVTLRIQILTVLKPLFFTGGKSNHKDARTIQLSSNLANSMGGWPGLQSPGFFCAHLRD